MPKHEDFRKGSRCLWRALLIGAALLAWLPTHSAVVAAPVSRPAQPSVSTLTVTRSDAEAVELTFTLADYQLVPAVDGTTTQVRVPGLEASTTPGQLHRPVRTARIGLPTAAGATVDILDAEYTTLPGIDLPLNAASVDVGRAWTPAELGDQILVSPVETTDSLPAQDRLYPHTPVDLVATGTVRGQTLARLQISPVLANPARHEVRIYHRLVIRVTWAQTGQAIQPVDAATRARLDGLDLLNGDALYRAAAHHAPVDRALVLSGGPTAAQDGHLPVLLHVDADGLYQVTGTELGVVGWNLSEIELARLQLWRTEAITIPAEKAGNQIEVALLVRDRDGDGVMDADDSLLFYGLARESRFTRGNVYKLVLGDTDGKRWMNSNVGPGSNSPVRLRATVEATEDVVERPVYWQNMPGKGPGEESPLDRWFWGGRLMPAYPTSASNAPPATRTYTFDLPALTAAPGEADAIVTVYLKGYTRIAHRALLVVNGQAGTETEWSGRDAQKVVLTLPSTALRETGNSLTVTALLDGASSVDNPSQFLLDRVRVVYTKDFVAHRDRFALDTAAAALSGQGSFAVSGFSTADILVLDMTDPDQPVRPVAVTEADGNGFRVAFGHQAGRAAAYRILTLGQVRSPAQIRLQHDDGWVENLPAYMVVAGPGMEEQATRLAAHHAGRADSAAVAIQAVYDAYTGGNFSPYAIRFLIDQMEDQHRDAARKAVVLMGDASQDYLQRLSTPQPNYVPSFSFESTLFGEISSDQWYLDKVAGCTALGLAAECGWSIGRLPAEDAQQAAAMVDKMTGYGVDAAWASRVLLVADNEPKFETVQHEIARRIPFYYHNGTAANAVDEAIDNAITVFADTYQGTDGNPAQAIAAAINQGVVLANYVGHGEYFAWGRWTHADGGERFIFSREDLDRLVNGDRLPIITVGNCLNGFFAGPSARSALSELMLRKAEGGAVAMLAPTGFGYPTGHRLLLNNFYAELFARDTATLGTAAQNALAEMEAVDPYWHELALTYILFGDPWLPISLSNPPYLTFSNVPDGGTNIPRDVAFELDFHKQMAAITPQLIQESTGRELVLAIEFTDDRQHVTIRPDDELFCRERYTMDVQGVDVAGTALRTGLAPTVWQFTTAGDCDGPRATVTLFGGANRQAAQADVPILVAFDEPVRPDSVVLSVVPLVNGVLLWEDPISGLYTPQPEGNPSRALFVHDGFITGTIDGEAPVLYAISVEAAVDVAGNQLAGSDQLVLRPVAGHRLYLPTVAREE